VSQSGEGFRGHTAIYYYWYPDSNRSGEFAGVQRRGDFLDLACRHIHEPGVDKVAMDLEIHYVLGRGCRGLYVYLVARHPARYPEARISFIQMIWPGPHTANEYLCENQYLDDSVKNLTLDGRALPRNGLQPTMKDEMAAVEVAGYPKEIRRYTTGLFAGQLNGKYSYTFDYPTLGTWGLASDKRPLGLWVVAGNHDYQNNGPTAAEYAGGYTGMLLFEPLIAHYGNTGPPCSPAANGRKFTARGCCISTLSRMARRPGRTPARKRRPSRGLGPIRGSRILPTSPPRSAPR
jgi:hypothetical protein